MPNISLSATILFLVILMTVLALLNQPDPVNYLALGIAGLYFSAALIIIPVLVFKLGNIGEPRSNDSDRRIAKILNVYAEDRLIWKFSTFSALIVFAPFYFLLWQFHYSKNPPPPLPPLPPPPLPLTLENLKTRLAGLLGIPKGTEPQGLKRLLLDAAELAYTTDHRENEKEYQDLLVSSLVKAGYAFVNEITPLMSPSSGLTVSAGSSPNLEKAILAFFAQLQHTPQFKDVKYFKALIDQYNRNWKDLYYARQAFLEKETKFNIDADGDPTTFALRETPFTGLASVRVPITIPQTQRFQGMHIVAPPGKGKTTLLSALLESDLKEVANGEASIIVFDSKPELSTHLRKLKVFTKELRDRLTLLEPQNLALNPLDLGQTSVDLYSYVLSGILDTAPTEKQLTYLNSILIGCTAIPNATIATVQQFLAGGWEQYRDHLMKLRVDDRDFFFKGRFNDGTYKTTREELGWRLDSLRTSSPVVWDMFRAPKTKIDIAKEMDAGKVIIIDNAIPKLGIKGSAFFARFFIALIRSAAERGRAGKIPVYVYMDEADTVIKNDPNIADIIQKCRSQNIALILAHQKLGQITNEQVQGALADCAIRMSSPDDDARELARRFRTDEESLRDYKEGYFALFITSVLRRPLTVRVEDNPIWNWPKMTEEEFRTIQHDMQKRYAYCPEPEPVSLLEAAEDDAPKPWKK